MQGIQLYLVVGAAIASALVGGVFYAFSSFVMAALQRLEPKDGMTAMQAINTTAVEPGLMVPFWDHVGPHRGGYHGNQQLGKRRLVGWVVKLRSRHLCSDHVPRNNALADTAIDDPNAPHVWTATLLNGPEEITSGRQRRWWRRLP